ncbi:MAG: type III-A CRISPR-associated protein Csm2 [Armatimonadota bacterium]|nr:type III-A CRISPR-associated protein Csm2 [Armatimonadota bacterium]
MSVVFTEAKPAALVETHARKLAEEVGGAGEATRSQMRRFYQEYLSLRQKIKSGGPNAYEENEPAIKMLIAKAAYASGRQSVKVPKKFVEWLEKNIKAIKSAEDVETFGQYFEAFMGYFYAQTQGSRRRDEEE